MCVFISGYKLPNGELRFHTDADVEAAWERAGKTEPINWQDMVGHSGYRFCFGTPPAGAVEVEGLQYAVNVDLRQFRKIAKGARYQSIKLRDAQSIAEGIKLYAEGDKLWDEGRKLYDEGIKLRDEGRELWDEGRKLRDEGRKLCFTIVPL